jgi:hypothetical protein
MEFDLQVGEIITLAGPEEPYQCASYTVTDFTLKVTIAYYSDSDTYKINVPVSVTAEETNGVISASVPLGKLKESWTDKSTGFQYNLELSISLLGCLEPNVEEGIGWLNLQIGTSLSCDVYGTECTADVSVVCPIISVED